MSTIWQKYGDKILVTLAIALVALVSFRAGQTYNKTQEIAKIDVNLNKLEAANPAQKEKAIKEKTAQRKGLETQKEKPKVAGAETECALIGSKNSDKAHKADCSYAKKIKGSNRVCFDSEAGAENKGYNLAKCCH